MDEGGRSGTGSRSLFLSKFVQLAGRVTTPDRLVETNFITYAAKEPTGRSLGAEEIDDDENEEEEEEEEACAPVRHGITLS